MSLTVHTRPRLPPFTQASCVEKVRLAEDGWNSRSSENVAQAYTNDTQWHNRADSSPTVKKPDAL